MIKKYILRNGKCFCPYFAFVMISFCLFAKSASFASFAESLGWVSWDDTVIIGTVFAFIINLAAMRDYISLLAKNKTLSVSSYLLLSLIMANVWFWVSVPPAVLLYFSCGGVMS